MKSRVYFKLFVDGCFVGGQNLQRFRQKLKEEILEEIRKENQCPPVKPGMDANIK